MKVNLNLFYGMLKSNPPAFHILVSWMVKHNYTLLNIVDEEEFPKNLHVIYTRLQDTFKNQIPISNGPNGEPVIIGPVKAPYVKDGPNDDDELFELVSIGEAIIFDIITGKPCTDIRVIYQGALNPEG
jgi:hypothetical protein